MGATLLTAIDAGLERLLRRSLPLPEDIGDVSFEPPDRSWGAQVTRITVNMFLFDVNRSGQPPRAPASRTRPDGQIERRPQMPLIQVSYLVTAWAGNTSDEHQLLGDVLRCLLCNPVLPTSDQASALDGTVQLALADRGARSLADLWSALDARPKPAFQLDVTAALASSWELAAAPVERIEGVVAPVPSGPVRRPGSPVIDGGRPALTRRRTSSGLITEARRDPPE